MLLLAKPGQRVSHVNLGQWWWAPDRSRDTLFLNNDAWDKPNEKTQDLNGRIYAEVKQLQHAGIKVLAQLTFFWSPEGFGQDGDFNEHLYVLLHNMLSRTGFDGVDLDVEDHATDNTKVARVIKRLKKDFGPEFLVTMAPGGRELLAVGSPGQGSLSSINYQELYKQIGSDIDWFNVQLYNSWGQLKLSNFEEYMRAGGDNIVYPAHKIVMSVASNEKNGGGWTKGAVIEENLPKILAAYPDVGGFSCWEWYNAVLASVEPGTAIIHPDKWFQFVYKLLYPHT